MMFNTSDLILDAVILSIVARTPEGTYGYKITQDVRSKMDVPESTFYPLLKQMQMDGYLEVYHKDLGGRSRRFYKITESGKERLDFCQQNWANYLQNASNLLMNGAGQSGEAVPAMQAGAAPQPQTPVMQAGTAPQPQAPVMQAQPAPQPQAPVMQAQPTPQPQAPVMQAQPAPQPQAPVMQAQSAPQPQTDFHVAGGNPLGDMEFSIGGDEPMVSGENGLSAEGDLFEFDTTPQSNAVTFDEAPANPEPVATEQFVQPEVPAAPVAMEQYVQPEAPVAPVAMEQYVQPEAPVAMEQFGQPEATVTDIPVAMEQPVQPEVPMNEEMVPVEMDMDDEADFIAEMAMGHAEEEEPIPEVAPESDAELDGIENTFAESAEISELEDLISQLHSFKDIMDNAHVPSGGASSETAPSANINITDVNGVAALLNEAATQRKTEQEESAPVAQQSTQAAPVQNNTSGRIALTEVRNPETDDAVNSLVDLLKEDHTSSKPKLFKGWRSKKSSKTAEPAAPASQPVHVEPSVQNTAPAPQPAAQPVPETPTPKVEYKAVSEPQNNGAVGGSTNLSQETEATATAPMTFTPNTQQVQQPAAPAPQPVAQPAPQPQMPVASKPMRPLTMKKVQPAPEDNSVDVLADLLMDDKPQSKPMSIFGKKSASSEPKVFKPSASKSFEEKAASPNARPVETTATITKSLDAKAISTKPTEAKPVEAKSVETKAVVTPKPDTAPAAEAEKQEEEVAMDSFKYRLMQANLLPEEK